MTKSIEILKCNGPALKRWKDIYRSLMFEYKDGEEVDADIVEVEGNNPLQMKEQMHQALRIWKALVPEDGRPGNKLIKTLQRLKLQHAAGNITKMTFISLTDNNRITAYITL